MFLKIMALLVLCAFAGAASGCDSPAVTSDGQSSPGAGEARPNSSRANSDNKAAGYGAPLRLAELEDAAVDESSGAVAARRTPGLFWTHNDSGDGPFIYALDRQGKRRGVWRVEGAKAQDWEDIAAGPGPRPNQSYLYIGDIGDNGRRREQIIIYRVAEPAVDEADKKATKSSPRRTEAAETIRLKYPDGKHDAEALMIHPVTGDLYIVTKTSGTAGVYRLKAPLPTTGVGTLVRVGQLRLPSILGSLVTGGDIAPDGLRVALCDYFNAYEAVLPARAEFDAIWGQPLATIDLGARRQGEAICYRLDGKALLATSEKRPTPLIEVPRAER